jgi:junctophilin
VGGSEQSGVYIWPGDEAYSGRWYNGNRNGLGVENRKGVLYCGEWEDDLKAKSGVLLTEAGGKYEGMWRAGLQNGYGVEIYADVGRYEGQWRAGKRHGYGVRVMRVLKVEMLLKKSSRSLSVKSHSQPDFHCLDGRQSLFTFEEGVHAVELGGMIKDGEEVRVEKSRRRSLARLRSMLLPTMRTRSRSLESIHPAYSDVEEVTLCNLTNGPIGCMPWRIGAQSREEATVNASDYLCYKGEWSDDQRCGFGVCEMTNGYLYFGSWERNTMHGYGRLENPRKHQCQQGRWENGQLVQKLPSSRLKKLLATQLQANVVEAVRLANQAAVTADEKAKFAVSKALVAREKSKQAKQAAAEARKEQQLAKYNARLLDVEEQEIGMSRIPPVSERWKLSRQV